MKTYNTALDYLSLAVAHQRAGKPVEAAQFFLEACAAPDAVRAVAIIETSNGQAFATTAAAKAEAKKIAASKKQAQASAPAKAKATVLKAKKRLAANEDGMEAEDGVVEFEPAEPAEPAEAEEPLEAAEEEIEVEDEDDGEDEDEISFDETFAKTLAAMTQERAKPKAKK